jgi:hypothetical protein
MNQRLNSDLSRATAHLSRSLSRLGAKGENHMRTSATPVNRATSQTYQLVVGVAALTLSFAVARTLPAHADEITPPAVPDNLQVQAGNTAFLVGHASGTQGYICQPAATGFAWTFVKPQATLFDDDDEQIITHFLSTNVFESPATARPTWQDSHDASRVWGKAIANSSDPNFVEADAIPWLLLQVVGSEAGRTGGTTLTATTYVQRLSTSGGVAPAAGCAQSTDVGNKALVSYTADYFFYKAE